MRTRPLASGGREGEVPNVHAPLDEERHDLGLAVEPEQPLVELVVAEHVALRLVLHHPGGLAVDTVHGTEFPLPRGRIVELRLEGVGRRVDHPQDHLVAEDLERREEGEHEPHGMELVHVDRHRAHCPVLQALRSPGRLGGGVLGEPLGDDLPGALAVLREQCRRSEDLLPDHRVVVANDDDVTAVPAPLAPAALELRAEVHTRNDQGRVVALQVRDRGQVGSDGEVLALRGFLPGMGLEDEHLGGARLHDSGHGVFLLF